MIEVARTELGRIMVDEAAVTHLIREAIEKVDGVHAIKARNGIRLTIADDRATAVSIGVVACAGVVLPDVAQRTQVAAARAVQAALEPRTLRVDVTIAEVAG